MKIKEVTCSVQEDELKINYNRLINRLQQKADAGDETARSLKNDLIQQWDNNKLTLKKVKKLLDSQ